MVSRKTFALTTTFVLLLVARGPLVAQSREPRCERSLAEAPLSQHERILGQDLLFYSFNAHILYVRREDFVAAALHIPDIGESILARLDDERSNLANMPLHIEMAMYLLGELVESSRAVILSTHSGTYPKSVMVETIDGYRCSPVRTFFEPPSSPGEELKVIFASEGPHIG